MGKKTDFESVHLVNHSKCMLAAFQNFRQDETMLDVTLVCDSMSIKAHKLVLSACSPFFKEIFSENPCSHPVIILRHFDFSDLKAIIDFIYKGELTVPRERLMSAIKVAEELQVRGLRRSEPNREKYEKLYNQVCGKLSARKKRKRHRHNSSDSEEKEYISVSDSDQNLIHSEESLSANEEALPETEPMDMDSIRTEENSEKDIRPVVLRVGDPVTSNEESISKNAYEDEECNVISSVEKNLLDNDSQKENLTYQKEETENQTCESVSESVATSSQLPTSLCSENSNVSLGCVLTDEQNNFQEQNTESISATECSEEQVGFISSSCLSPKTLEAQQNNETKLQDEGKRFICSKCDKVFTSRICFMKHKTLGHSTMEKRSPYKCQHCNFTAEKLDYFKSHLLTHWKKMLYKCSECPEEFTSEELYKKHLSVHEVEKISLHSLSPELGQDLCSQDKNPEKSMEFRCSICFIKFASKLRCQIHEKTCQGGS